LVFTSFDFLFRISVNVMSDLNKDKKGENK
jgi:hypothetical protein